VFESLLRLKNGKAINTTENSKRRGRNILPRLRGKAAEELETHAAVYAALQNSPERVVLLAKRVHQIERNQFCLLPLQHPLQFFILRHPYRHPRWLKSHMQNQHRRGEGFRFVKLNLEKGKFVNTNIPQSHRFG
jgi:hypothetical protein